MKNQYFGDINDYRKYGLLRALQNHNAHKLLVAWMLTPDDDRKDGLIRGYLKQPDMRCFDEKLYDGLKTLLQRAPSPRVSLIERSGLLPSTSYYSDLVPDDLKDRDEWGRGLLRAVSGQDLVFLDPDMGIEIKSKRIGWKKSSQYVAWKEIEEVWNAGCSLLIYQHFPHKPHDSFADSMIVELRKRTCAPLVQGFKAGNVLFLLAAQARHESAFRKSMASFLPSWKGEINITRTG